MRRPIQVLLILVTAMCPASLSGQVSSLECPPLLPGNNGGSGCMVDIENISSTTITLQDFDQSFVAQYGGVTVDVWMRPGGIQGDTNNLSLLWSHVVTTTIDATRGIHEADPVCVDLTVSPLATLSPGARVGFYVTVTSAAPAIMSYTNQSGTPGVTEAASDGSLRVYRGYGVPRTFSGVFPGRTNNFIIHYNTFGGPGGLRAQENSAAATLELNGAQGSSCELPTTEMCTGQQGILSLRSNLPAQTPFDVGIQVGPALYPGLHVFGGSMLNLDLLSAPAVWLGTGQAGLPTAPLFWSGSPFDLVWFAGPPVVAHAQGYFINPAGPSGVSLTAPVQLEIVPATVAGPLLIGDDDSIEICRSIGFYGTVHSRLFINANGNVTFLGGDSDFSPTVSEFLTGPPRIAGLWTDLEPNTAGTVSVSYPPSGVLVSFAGVQEWGVTGSLSSFDISLSLAGLARISSYAPSPTHAAPCLVGFSPGASGGATNPGPLSISMALNLGPQSNAPTDALFELNSSGPPPGGWNVFELVGDASRWEVR